MRRAYLIVGWEGSGTHCLTDAFRSIGCHEEPFHGGYPEDGNYKFDEMPDLFVFRRSLPHARVWPDLLRLRGDMEKAGYKVQPLMTVRDWNATIKSVIRRDYQRDPWVCENNMRVALLTAISSFPDDLILVTYEAFCLSAGFRRWLFCDRLELPKPTLQIHFANPKYYDGG